MKKLFTLFSLVIAFLLIVTVGNAQQWRQNLPDKKDAGYTLTDYQKAFNEYWAPYKVEDGFYINDKGEKVKAPGWKQFKRWDWYWKTRVDNVTGEFPNTSVWEELEKWKAKYPQNKSQFGTWVELGPANLDRQNNGALQENGTGRLNCMTFDPNDATHFWVGAPSGGVWESTNAGSTWTCLTDDNAIIGVSVIALPSNYNKTTNPTIYIATGDRDAVDDPSIGILKTTDGGLTWNTTGLSFNASEMTRIGGLVCSPTDANTLVAATFKGIYKSTDAGATWSQTSAVGNFIDMDLIPGTSTLIATTIGSPAAYRSTDFGSTWTNVWTGIAGAGGEYRCDVATTGASTSVVYLITDTYDYSGIYGIYRSSNGGVSYTKVYDGYTQTNIYGWTTTATETAGGQGWYDCAIAVSNTNSNVVYVGGVNGWISTNGAASFVNCNIWDDSYGTSDEVHADHHNAYFRPGDNRLYDVNDGGVYYCDNVTLGASSTWTSITDGIITGQLYDIGISRNTPGYIVAGFQDNGTKLMLPTDGIYDWTQVKGGDGMCCDISPVAYATQWGTYTNLQVDQTTNTWGSASSIRGSGSAAWAGPLEADPLGTYVYIGTASVERYPKAKDDPKPPSLWLNMSGTLDGTNYLSALDIFNDGTNIMIWTASPAGCWKSPLGGGTGSGYTLLSNLPSNVVTDIAIDEDNYNHVYVSFGGFNSIKVWETTNGGTSWIDISEGLPSVPASSIVINETNTAENEVYVGTDAGVFVKLGTAPWQLFTGGMPYVSITDLEIYSGATPVLYAATYGRGIWKSDCYTPPTLDLALCNIVEPVTEYCAPGSFIPTFTLANIGTTTITSATVSYTIDGGAPVIQNWTGSLVRGASINVTFPVVPLTFGSHDIEVTISNPNGVEPDQNTDNNTLSRTFTLWDNSMPYAQTFDAFPLGGNTNNYDGSTVALSECWVNETTDDIDWSVHSGISPSGGTGPSADHTSGSGVYLYTESSGPNGNKNLKASSPAIDLTNYTSSQVTFWYHMYGANMGSLQIDLFYNGVNHPAVPVYWSSTGSTTTSISGDQGNQWYQATVNISAADGANDFVFTFNATTGADYLSEMAIDDFSVTGTPATACTYPTIQASNFGATPALNSINVTWTRGNGNNVLVIARQGSAVNQDPSDGVNYTANAAFGSGSQIGTGNYVVYNGPLGAVNVTALTSSTTYHFALYEYTTTGYCYLKTELVGNSTTTSPPTFSWSGATSSNWQSTTNWSSGVLPTLSDDVTIPTGCSFYPVINNGISTPALCNNLTISGGSVTIAPGGYMTVAGSITNTVGNLGLLINSDATGTGSLIHNSGSGVAATVQSYNAGTQWHMFSSPINNASFTVLPTLANTIQYDESTADYWTGMTYGVTSVSGWTAVGANMVNAKGYVHYFNTNATLNYTGTLNPNTTTGAIVVPYTNHGVTEPNTSASWDDFDGWNLIGNPYTSAIDWDDASVDHAGANLLNAVYTYDDKTAHNYTSYVGGVSTNGGSRYIPAMQGFFVKGDATETGGTLNIGANARVHNALLYWKGYMETPSNFIRLEISGNGFKDETVVRMLPDATNAMDNGMDAYKFFTWHESVPQIYTRTEGSADYSINTVPVLEEGSVSVPIRMVQTGESYSIRISEFNFIGVKVYLKDNLNSVTEEIALDDVIELTADESDANGRYELVFEKSSSSIDSDVNNIDVTIYPNPNEGTFTIRLEHYYSGYELEIANVIGQLVYKNVFEDAYAKEIKITGANAGVYFLKIRLTDGSEVNRKIIVNY
jgi:hypothetical protein